MHPFTLERLVATFVDSFIAVKVEIALKKTRTKPRAGPSTEISTADSIIITFEFITMVAVPSMWSSGTR